MAGHHDHEHEHPHALCHDHGHEHDSGHAHGLGHAGHHHGPASYDRAFAIGLILNLGFVAVEGGYGFTANSLALLADAGHNFSDVVGLVLAWTAAWLSKRRPSKNRTYGFGRTTIIASLINAVILLIAVGGIAWEAVLRLQTPQPVPGQTVMAVAAIGILVNGITAALFMSGRKDDLNIRGAFLHMAADAAVSLGVVVAALIMMRTGWLWLDPSISLVIVAVIAVGTWGLFRESLDLALDAVPAGIDRETVVGFLESQSGVASLHDLHIWPLSTTSVALTAHLVNPDGSMDDDRLNLISEALHDKFGIDHATFQVERGNGAASCRLEHVHSV